MKDMKLATKLALGFGILVIILLCLGSLAVWEMGGVSDEASQLSKEDMPMIQAASEAEVDFSLAREEIRVYLTTGEDGSRLKGLSHLVSAKAHAKEVIDLADKYAGLAAMKDGARKSAEKLGDYETLVTEIETRRKAIAVWRASQDKAIAKFISDCIAFRNALNNPPAAAAAPETAVNADLKAWLARMRQANDIMDAASNIRLAGSQSSSMQKSGLAETGPADFDSLAKKLSELSPMVDNQADKDRIAEIGHAAEQCKTAMDGLLAEQKALDLLREKHGTLSESVTATVGGTDEAGTTHVTGIARQLSKDLVQASWIMIVGLLAAFMTSIFITVYLTRSLTRPLRDAANVLASSASEISASVTQVTSGAQETATAVTETTATVEEVKQTAHLTSQKSKAIADSAQQGVQLAHAGRKSMESVADGMKRINEQMASIADTIVRLGEQSQAIGEITATVDDIAEQSNLLAVNAAVEAAKAGEHGKGFAVVAQEIKALAEQSKQATRQVRTILNDIQKATGAAVMATERGSKAVEQGMKESNGASESIQAMTASLADTAQSGVQIAASTQEQLTGMDQVAQAMESIKEASQQNVASMRQLEEAAQILKDVGSRFAAMVG